MMMMSFAVPVPVRRPVQCNSGGDNNGNRQQQQRHVMLQWGVFGWVGPRVSSFVVTEPRPQVIQVRCVNNKRFYMYLDTANMQAWGATATMATRAEESFVVQHSPEHRIIGVTSRSDPRFWVNLRHCQDVLYDDDP